MLLLLLRKKLNTINYKIELKSIIDNIAINYRTNVIILKPDYQYIVFGV